jgi:hypothetical protein
MSEGLERFLAAAPWPQRPAMRLLLELARRPRGARLLARTGALGQAGHAVLVLGRYDDERVARALGFDAAAVVARGRELRRREGRP